MKIQWRPDRWGLSSRIVALSLLLLLLVVQAAVFSVVRISIDQSARRQVAQELQVGERVWRRLLDQNAQKLSQGATVLAADFGFRSAVNSGDIDTIASALENNGARIGATVTALMDTNLSLRAVGEGQDAAALRPLLGTLVQPLSRDPQGSQIAMVGPVPYQFVMVPMKAPRKPIKRGRPLTWRASLSAASTASVPELAKKLMAGPLTGSSAAIASPSSTWPSCQ